MRHDAVYVVGENVSLSSESASAGGALIGKREDELSSALC